MTMATKVKIVSCHDHDPNCQFSVSDVDEAEVIAVAQDHARRKHSMEVTADQVRAIIKEKECTC
jgi:predicted small metal-binding protein